MKTERAEELIKSHFLQRRSGLVLLESAKSKTDVRDGDLFQCKIPHGLSTDVLNNAGWNVGWISQARTEASTLGTCSFSLDEEIDLRRREHFGSSLLKIPIS